MIAYAFERALFFLPPTAAAAAAVFIVITVAFVRFLNTVIQSELDASLQPIYSTIDLLHSFHFYIPTRCGYRHLTLVCHFFDFYCVIINECIMKVSTFSILCSVYTCLGVLDFNLNHQLIPSFFFLFLFPAS